MLSLLDSPELDCFGPAAIMPWAEDIDSLAGSDLPGVRLAHDLRLLDMGSSPPGRPPLWLEDVLPIKQIYYLKCNDWSYLGQSGDTFRILLVRGNEVDALAHQVSFVRTILPSKFIVPVMDMADRSAIARLLRSGADDIFHVAMDPLELKSRLSGLLRRQYLQESSRSNNSISDNQNHLYVAMATRYRLSVDQNNLVKILVKRRGKTVTYAEFLGKSQANCAKMRMKLAYRIHCLRSKLGGKYAIRNVSSQGYYME